MKLNTFWAGLLSVLLVLMAFGLMLGGEGGHNWNGGLPGHKDLIAVVPVDGELVSADLVVDLLHHYRTDVPGVKAVVLAIDSPGGGVAVAQEIVDAIKAMQEAGIYVVASMGSLAASGGYYIAAPCDHIWANEGSLTGSIGVIMETVDASKVLNKIGLDFEVIKSGEFKDAGSFSRPLTDRERHLFQGVINDVYGQFLDLVVEERKDPIRSILAHDRKVKESEISDAAVRDFVKGYADGRVFSGRQALQYGLVDSLGGLDAAINDAADLAGIQHPEIVTYREPRSLTEILTGISKLDLKTWANEALQGQTRRIGYYAW